jgi:TolB protein
VVYQRLPSQLKDAATLAFSPDGSHVAFESKGNLFIMSVGGSTPVPLTDGYDMAWSPDGSKLAFTRVVTVSKSGYDVQGIFVVNTECVDNQTDCKSSTTLLGRGRSPRWSPEGARIVFSDIDDDSFLKGNIYVMNSDGSGRTRLTNVEGENDAFDPAWSPDGQTIAFALSSDTCPCPRPVQIYLMTMGSSDPIYLTDGTNPIWSPDGRHIAFISDRNSEGKSFSLFDTIFRVNSLYLIARDGKETIRLTHGSNDSIYAFSWVTQ